MFFAAMDRASLPSVMTAPTPPTASADRRRIDSVTAAVPIPLRFDYAARRSAAIGERSPSTTVRAVGGGAGHVASASRERLYSLRDLAPTWRGYGPASVRSAATAANMCGSAGRHVTWKGLAMTTFTVETVEPQQAAVVRAEVPMAQLRDVFDRGFAAVMQVMQSQGVAIVGPPFGYYPRMPGETVAVLVGFPVARPIAAEGEVEPFELPGGPAVTATHVGSYEALAETYEQLMAWTADEGLTLAERMWESYLSDPRTEPDPNTWRTLIVWPIDTTT